MIKYEGGCYERKLATYLRAFNTMAVRRLVEVEYEYPDVGPMACIGQIKESDDYVVVISQWIEGYDLCRYMVIPKSLVEKIIELGVEG